MAALDFPASPTVGQKYPSPAVAGVPVYSWDGEKWTTLGGAIGSTGASDAIPQPDTGTGAAGSSTLWSRGDHAHPAAPTDLTRAPINNPVFTGDPQAPTPAAADNDTSIATTAFVKAQGYAPLASPTFTGDPQAPTPAAADNDTSIATTAFVKTAVGGGAGVSGLQINGAMEVNQEGFTATANGKYCCDGWKLQVSGTMAVTAQPVTSPLFAVFPSCMQMTVGTAQASIGAGDYTFVQQPIEGYRISKLGWGAAGAQPITVSFWSRNSRVGTYSVAIRNGATNRSYVATYTQAIADIPQFNSITIPGDTAGTWPADNSVGMYLAFTVAAGSTSIAPTANTWSAGNFFGAPGQVNGVAATSDFMRITGVSILPGSTGPTAANSALVLRPYGEELGICKRYYRRLGGQASQDLQNSGYAWSAGSGISCIFTLEPTMRTAPTASQFGTFASSNVSSTNLITSTNTFHWQIVASAGSTQAQSYSNVGGFILDARM